MRTRVGLALVVAIAATVAVAAAALALTQSDIPPDTGQEGALLAKGSTVSGEPYTISRMSEEVRTLMDADGPSDISNGSLCLEVRAHGFGGGGCIAPPSGGKLQPTQTSLGDDMIVYALADDSVAGFRVARADGQGDIAYSSDPVAIGSYRLFHAVLHTPNETRPVIGDTPMPPTVDIQALDSDGRVKDRQTLDLSSRQS